MHSRLDTLAAQHQTRLRVLHNHDRINFASNDYLQLSKHPDVIQAATDACVTSGVGSTGSAMLSGFHHYHQQLELLFAEFLGREYALLFNTGYQANIGIFSALCDRHSVVFSDKYCHASIIDGITLSRAKHKRFKHQDFSHLEQLLKQENAKHKVIVTESIFSMQGQVTDITPVIYLAEKYQAKLMIDDAHGVGVLGANGKGIIEHAHANTNAVAILVSTFGKALGTQGAIVSGSQTIIETIKQCARSYMYSTALALPITAASIQSLALIQSQGARRIRLHRISQAFNTLATKMNLPFCASDSPIKILITGDNQKTLEIQEYCRKKYLEIAAIRPPSVPKGGARLRISLHSDITPQDIETLFTCLKECGL